MVQFERPTRSVTVTPRFETKKISITQTKEVAFDRPVSEITVTGKTEKSSSSIAQDLVKLVNFDNVMFF